jgi:hypothetical protein
METLNGSSPLRLTGVLDPRLSRWLWLVKMILAIPHFVVLAALWAAFIVVTLIAGAAILFTGRYPRRLFDFAVGVMRWNWRVGFYVHAALGTDRYPPFSFSADAPAGGSYPAALEVAYPERLSRWLVLAKWPLALPHLLVVGLIVADIMLYPAQSLNELGGAPGVAGGYSVINLLVVIAGFFLLVTGSHPRGLFDLLMGVNRWLYRVLTYVALMHDEYPPFRLDQGQHEPGDVEPDPRITLGQTVIDALAPANAHAHAHDRIVAVR